MMEPKPVSIVVVVLDRELAAGGKIEITGDDKAQVKCNLNLIFDQRDLDCSDRTLIDKYFRPSLAAIFDFLRGGK